MAKILLINPKKDVPLLDWAMRYPPLGLMYLAGALEGHNVEILDLKVDNIKKKDLISKIASANFLGITVLTPSIDSALELCRIAKEYNVSTILGGVHPSLMPNIIANPEVDIVVRGEGELSFKELVDGKPLDSILGISYKHNGKIIHNPDRPSADLNELPPPRRDLVKKYRAKYNAWRQRLDALSTARGCPYSCSFCCVPRIWKGYREQSPREVVNEIKRMDPKAKIISIVDDNFCHNMKRVKEICQLIIEEGLNKQYRYSVFSRIDSIVKHPEIVELMAKANIRVVFIGIEAASQLSLNKMHKGTKLEDIHKACEILEKNGIMIWAGHIIGNLDDTYEDIEALIKLSKSLPVDVAQFTIITPYPGTELYDLAKEKNLIDEYDFNEYCECEPPMHTPHLSRLELLELEMKAYLKFYGFWAMIKRARRWSKNKEKKWMGKQSLSLYRAFLKFRNKSAFYLIRTYKELIGETERTKNKISRRIPILSTPKLYSFSTAINAAIITFLITIFLAQGYGNYNSLPFDIIIIDFLFSSLLVASSTAFVATWLAVWLYRRGWILSLKKRKPKEHNWTLFSKAMKNSIFCGIIAAIITGIAIFIIIIVGFPYITYEFKEILIVIVAFITTFIISLNTVHHARSGDISIKI
ncbi:MAG: B12-binding domain-containing radical SAM protein [Promethearchaeota archaeon]